MKVKTHAWLSDEKVACGYEEGGLGELKVWVLCGNNSYNPGNTKKKKKKLDTLMRLKMGDQSISFENYGPFLVKQTGMCD